MGGKNAKAVEAVMVAASFVSTGMGIGILATRENTWVYHDQRGLSGIVHGMLLVFYGMMANLITIQQYKEGAKGLFYFKALFSLYAFVFAGLVWVWGNTRASQFIVAYVMIGLAGVPELLLIRKFIVALQKDAKDDPRTKIRGVVTEKVRGAGPEPPRFAQPPNKPRAGGYVGGYA